MCERSEEELQALLLARCRPRERGSVAAIGPKLGHTLTHPEWMTPAPATAPAPKRIAFPRPPKNPGKYRRWPICRRLTGCECNELCTTSRAPELGDRPLFSSSWAEEHNAPRPRYLRALLSYILENNGSCCSNSMLLANNSTARFFAVT